MKPALSTIAIFTFLQAWNELMFATVFVSDSAHRTLTVGIQSLSGTYSTNWGPIGAALVIATFPTLVIYLFMSKKSTGKSHCRSSQRVSCLSIP